MALYRGRPNPKRDGVAIDAATADRFARMVDRTGGPEACWPWEGGRSGFGYGRFKVSGKLISPHRIAYVLKHGKLVPDGTYHGGMVMHSCDNPICCNPKHLKLGSAAENARDMARKKRAYPQSAKFRERQKEAVSSHEEASTPVPALHFVGFRGDERARALPSGRVA